MSVIAGDPFDLERFVAAQDGGEHERAVAELRAGRKRTHWIWYELPQLAGLGRSATAQRYGIGSLGEARAYLAHPVLGSRLRELVDLLLASAGTDATAIFGELDAMKARSSMTLFHEAAGEERRFQAALDRFWGGEPDARTLELLAE